MINWLKKILKRKVQAPHVCNLEVVHTLGYNYMQFLRCKCGKGAINQKGFNLTLTDHPYGK